MPGKKESEEQRRKQILQAAFTVALRERIEHMTIRQVAAEAGLSNGLVFFHFKSKEALLLALLDWLMDDLFEIWQVRSDLPPQERLLDLLGQDMRDAYKEQKTNEQVTPKMELVFDYWLLSSRDPEIRTRMQRGLARSQQMFLPVVEDLIAGEPERFQGVRPNALIALLISVVQGYTLQTFLYHSPVDIEQILAAVRALLTTPEKKRQGASDLCQ